MARRGGPDALLIGTVGRLVEANQQLGFVEAIRLLRKRGIDARAVIVGEGPERPRIEAEIVAADLAGHLQLVGARDDIAEVLAAFDPFALGSDREGHPLTALEAQAAGTPVMSTSSS